MLFHETSQDQPWVLDTLSKACSWLRTKSYNQVVHMRTSLNSNINVAIALVIQLAVHSINAPRKIPAQQN